MNYWYVARANELFLDIDNVSKSIKHARARLQGAIECGKLDVAYCRTILFGESTMKKLFIFVWILLVCYAIEHKYNAHVWLKEKIFAHHCYQCARSHGCPATCKYAKSYVPDCFVKAEWIQVSSGFEEYRLVSCGKLKATVYKINGGYRAYGGSPFHVGDFLTLEEAKKSVQ